MAQILRVIPNSLYESLSESGEIAKQYPTQNAFPHEQLLKDIPVTLLDKARTLLKILNNVRGFSWKSSGEVTINDKPVLNSNLGVLINHLVHQSSRFYSTVGHKELLQVLQSLPLGSVEIPSSPKHTSNVIKKQTSCKWVSFEENFTVTSK
jgi:hypothetical protein